MIEGALLAAALITGTVGVILLSAPLPRVAKHRAAPVDSAIFAWLLVMEDTERRRAQEALCPEKVKVRADAANHYKALREDLENRAPLAVIEEGRRLWNRYQVEHGNATS